MADDMTEAEAQAQALGGIENHPYGFILLRMVRLTKLATGRLANIDDRVGTGAQRVRDLEARVAALEAKQPAGNP